MKLNFNLPKMLVITAVLVMSVAFCSAKSSSGNVITKSYPEKDFNSISLKGACDVELREGNFSVHAVGDESSVKNLTVSKRGSTLELINKGKGLNFIQSSKSTRLVVVVFAPDIKKIEIVGSGDVKVMSPLHPRADFAVSITGSGDVEFLEDFLAGNQSVLKLDINGSGDIKFKNKAVAEKTTVSICGSGDVKFKNLSVNHLSASIAGSGDLFIAGKGNTADFSVLSSGDISAYHFIVQSANASVVGSGNIKCYVEDSLTSSTVGSGDIYYKGNPKHVTKSSSGSGKAIAK